MKLVINIPKAYYEYLKNTTEIVSCQRNAKVLTSVILNAVAKGEPLKKDEINNVAPQQKTGRWIGHGGEYGLSTIEWCSNCDFGIDIRESSRNHYKYCPNCGSKMEDKQ
jgi:hypothetical protein